MIWIVANRVLWEDSDLVDNRIPAILQVTHNHPTSLALLLLALRHIVAGFEGSGCHFGSGDVRQLVAWAVRPEEWRWLFGPDSVPPREEKRASGN
jgi:hypothetical protein